MVSRGSNLEHETDRLAALPLGADAGISREQAMELISALQVSASRLTMAEQQANEYRSLLEEAGLLPRR